MFVTNRWTRRAAMKGMALGGLSLLPAPKLRAEEAQEQAASLGKLKPWTPGALDIHHISTGRGNVAFAVCPDGTTMLIDAGALHSASDWGSDEKYRIQPIPDASLRPGQWIARYISRHMPAGREPEIDCFILTHLHPDHMGGLNLLPHRKVISRFGDYELTGIMDVHEEVPVRRILDRGYPDYHYPLPLNDPHQLNYRAFVASFLRRGGIVERFSAGSSTQVRLQHSSSQAHPEFVVQNLCANGRVWIGNGEAAEETFPLLRTLEKADYPSENKCSVALRLTFGSFRYFSGGDMDHDTAYGRLPWGDIEARVARAAGKVDVAVANHHGYVNACGPDWVAALQPRAFIISAWDSAHPTIPALDNMLSRKLYDQPRDVFSTALKSENKITTKGLHEIQSGDGHVIVRVPAGGDTFEIAVTTNRDDSDNIVSRFGPYRTAAKARQS